MSDLTGQTIGPYRLVDKLGEGGMATVYKAYHPRLDRSVALKCIHPQLVAVPGFLQRFEREAQILARLSHPNIVHLYDFGAADGHCYLAMEYGAGGTLKDHQQALQAAGMHMGVDEVQRVLLQVSAGLDYAHQHGILHRDIKPSNILLTQDGRALLSDFGLARMIDIPSDLTSQGAMIGTPAYLSPEQGRGETATIGPPSDVYALGVVLYELLTGHLPFTAETPLGVVLKQLNDPIPSARDRNPALPQGLDAVLRTALAKDPAGRYQGAEELAQAFQGAMAVAAQSRPAVVLHQSVPLEAASPLSAQANALTMTAPPTPVTSRRAMAVEQPMTFGALLRRYREAAGLSQEELAERAGLTVSAIGALERGERKRPYPHTLQRLARALDLDETRRAALIAALPSRGTSKPTSAPMVAAMAARGASRPDDGHSRPAGDRVPDQLPADVTVHALGDHPLNDLRGPEQSFQVVTPDLPNHVPSLRAQDTQPNPLPAPQIPLLTTKLFIPAPASRLVPRVQLIERLNEAMRRKLTLIAAPTGFGKTTLLSAWSHQRRSAVAWVSLDASDNDPTRFWTYMLAAVETLSPGITAHARLLLQAPPQQAPLIELMLTALINDLASLSEDVAVVLDDYHLITAPPIHDALVFLLDHLPAHMHLVIATRADPPLPLARLRGRGELTELRAAELRFTDDEAAAFLNQVMDLGLAADAIATLEARTEGWIAGLQLAALSLQGRTDSGEFIRAFSGSQRYILDYLVEEVLGRQPAHLKTFLLQTSILDRLSGPLCDAVLGLTTADAGRTTNKTDGATLGAGRSSLVDSYSRLILDELERANLFLIPLDDERLWYRYHALFGELLKNQLLHAEPERVDDLHERAAGWYQKHGFIQKAVEHAFQISSRDKVSKLIEMHAFPLLYQGEVSTVVGWFDRLPESLMQYSPMLCISKAWSLALMQRQTRTEEVEQALQAADDALNLAHADAALRNLIAGHIASIQAFLMQSPAFAAQKPEELIETSQKAQKLLPENEKAIRSVNALNIGYGYTVLADLPAAERAYKQAFEDGVASGNWYAAIYGAIDWIVVAIIKGQLKDALQLCERNIVRFNQLVAGQRFPPIGDLYILKGSLLLEENRLAEAEQVVTQGLSLVRWTGEYEAHIRGYAALARLRSIQGDWTGMLESLKMLGETRPETAIYAEALRHRLSIQYWAANKTCLDEAHRWVAQAAARFSNIPDISGVDPVSRISFQSYLSAAHILTRLAARNPPAYPLRDVHSYLARQERFAETHELVGWLLEIWIVRAVMYQVEGKAEHAHHMIHAALARSAPRGYFRIFLDEADLVRPLLEWAEARLKDNSLPAFVQRLLEAMPGETAKGKINFVDDQILSERELEVLRYLAAGLTYPGIAERLIISINTVRYHVKEIYGRLGVSSRAEAIAQAREQKLL